MADTGDSKQFPCSEEILSLAIICSQFIVALLMQCKVALAEQRIQPMVCACIWNTSNACTQERDDVLSAHLPHSVIRE